MDFGHGKVNTFLHAAKAPCYLVSQQHYMDAISSVYKLGIKCKSYADMEMAGTIIRWSSATKASNMSSNSKSHLGLMLEPLRYRYEPMISTS